MTPDPTTTPDPTKTPIPDPTSSELARRATAGDIMIPLDQCTVVDEDATMVEALQALDVAQSLVPEGVQPHRIVLVRDARGAIVGKLGHHALLGGLEPRHLGVDGEGGREGYTRKYLLSIVGHAPCWKDELDRSVKRAMTSRVGDVMHPVAEQVDIDASIGQVVSKLARCNERSLVVTEGDRPVGMLQLTDLFSVVPG